MTAARTTTRTRLLLDVTIAATTDLNTGIQRVVRNITRHAEAVGQELGFEVLPIVCHGSRMSAVGFDGRPRWDERIFRSIGRGWMGFHRGLARLFSRCQASAGDRYLAALSRLRKLLVPKTLVRQVGHGYRRLTGQSIHPRENDVLVLLDASWDLALEPLLELARAHRLPIVTVVYDLIPILHPQFHPQQLRDVFGRWFAQVLQHSDLMLGISRTVQADLVPFVEQKVRTGQKPCALDWFRLGADFVGDASARLTAAARTTRASRWPELKPGDYYLAVGTIEPRKNHAFLLDAFEQLWRDGSSARLVIAGKIGWMCEAVADRIRQHPEINRRLFFSDGISDQELNQLYAGAKALVFPSFVEGFGLPIVEAFQHRIPVLASDTRIHREVAGDQAHYFGLDDPLELVDLIQRIESHDWQLRVPDGNWITWQASCRDFLTRIDRFLKTRADDGEMSQRKEAA